MDDNLCAVAAVRGLSGHPCGWKESLQRVRHHLGEWTSRKTDPWARRKRMPLLFKMEVFVLQEKDLTGAVIPLGRLPVLPWGGAPTPSLLPHGWSGSPSSDHIRSWLSQRICLFHFWNLTGYPSLMYVGWIKNTEEITFMVDYPKLSIVNKAKFAFFLI